MTTEPVIGPGSRTIGYLEDYGDRIVVTDTHKEIFSNLS